MVAVATGEPLAVARFFPFEEGGRRLVFVVENAAFAEADDAGWALADRLLGVERTDRRELTVWLEGRFGSAAALEAFERLEILAPFGRPRMPPDLVPAELEPLGSLVLHVAHDCNMRCGYCYADFGRYGAGEGLMSEAMAIEHVDRFFDQLGDRRKLHVTMFGGEPLMNMPVVYAAHAHAKARAEREGRGVSFGITTNGTLLTPEIAEFLKREGFTVTVSIDGPPDVNDRLRPLHNGGDSYALIMEKVRASGLRPVARVTLTRRSLQVDRIVRHLVAAGFADVGVSPVASGSDKFDIPEDELDTVLEGMKRLADDFVEWAKRGEVLPFSNLRMLLEQIAAGEPRKLPCGAGSALVAADDKGDLYACHRLVGQPAFKIGDRGGVDRAARLKLVSDMHPRGRAPCEACWARYLCGGGCHHIGWLHSEKGPAPWTLSDGFCDFLRSWYRLGLYTYARVLEEAPEILSRVPRTKAACHQPLGL